MQGDPLELQEPLHHNLPRQGAGDGGVLASGQESDREQDLCGLGAHSRGQQLVGVGQRGNLAVLCRVVVEGGCREDEDAGVDEEGYAQAGGRVRCTILDCAALALRTSDAFAFHGACCMQFVHHQGCGRLLLEHMHGCGLCVSQTNVSRMCAQEHDSSRCC